MIKNLRRRHKSIIVALLCLMTTSAVSAYYILKPNHVAEQTTLGRLPASIEPLKLVANEPTFFESKKKATASFETTLKLDCQDLFANNAKLTSATVSSGHVILKFSRCNSTITEMKKIELVNKTNGYNAQLFKLNKAELNSDFIQLDEGENQLEFEISLNDGQKKLQILKIQRIQ